MYFLKDFFSGISQFLKDSTLRTNRDFTKTHDGYLWDSPISKLEAIRGSNFVESDEMGN